MGIKRDTYELRLTNSANKQLVEILLKAGLITRAQIEVAEQDRKEFPHLELGDILVLRGWLKSQTVDFFVDQWSQELKQKIKQPLGYYLRESGLLSEDNLNKILEEQKQNNQNLRLGELAVKLGYIKQETIDFFLIHLVKNTSKSTPISGLNFWGILRLSSRLN